jgi:PAS domain S-box-containing protein
MTPHHAFSVEELERALVGAEVGVWSWDISSNTVRWSAQTERIFGLPPGSFGGTLEAYVAYVHPDDIESVRTAIQRAVTLVDRSFRLSHRAIRADATVVWIESRGAVIQNATGGVIGMLGTVMECTEAKRNEEQIRKNEELYRLFTELSTDWVYRADLTQPNMVPDIVLGSFARTTG